VDRSKIKKQEQKRGKKQTNSEGKKKKKGMTGLSERVWRRWKLNSADFHLNDVIISYWSLPVLK